MAGATNRALKAAGVPKASIKTIRVEQGGRLSLRSALVVAHARGLDVGKAHEHLARRDAKEAASPKAVAARKAAMLADRQKRVAGSLGDTAKGMLARRKAAAVAARKVAADEEARRTRTEEARKRLADKSTARSPFSDTDRKQWIREGVSDYKRQVSDAHGRRAAAPAGAPMVHLQQVGKTPGKKAGAIKAGDTLVYNFGATAKVLNVRDHSPKFVMVTTESGGKQYTQKMGRDRLVAYDPR